MVKKVLIIFCLFLNAQVYSQSIKILFDASKAEMAGNADWIIDSDLFNLGTNFNGAMVEGRGDDSNPQNIPTPSQDNITPSTLETYWSGGISNWAIDLVKKGFHVETLPYNDSITYGNSSHALDLSNYKVFIIAEPNILFSYSQKNAIINFVQNGGGLFIISDHDVSDRNGDGYDSPSIWNDLFDNNSIQPNPFGMNFDLQSFSQTSSNLAILPNDSCLHGPLGDVAQLKFSSGTSISLDPLANPSVRGLVFKNGASNTGNIQVLFATARYGNGKVCAIGDSSPSDDGTGDQNDFLYFSYTGEANGSHQKLLVNSTLWLASGDLSSSIQLAKNKNVSFNISPNPSQGKFILNYNLTKPSLLSIQIIDLTGRIVFQNEKTYLESGISNQEYLFQGKGYYILQIKSSEGTFSKSIIFY